MTCVDWTQPYQVVFIILSSWCLVTVVLLFLTVPWVCLQLVIVIFTDHTHLLFLCYFNLSKCTQMNKENANPYQPMQSGENRSKSGLQ